VRARQAAGCPSTAELVTPDRARAISARAAGLIGPPGPPGEREASAHGRPRDLDRVQLRVDAGDGLRQDGDSEPSAGERGEAEFKAAAIRIEKLGSPVPVG